MTVIDKQMVCCCCFSNIIKYITCAYKNTIMDYLKNPKSTPILSLYNHNRCNGHHRIYTFGFFQFSHVFVLHHYRGKRLIVYHNMGGIYLTVSTWDHKGMSVYHFLKGINLIHWNICIFFLVNYGENKSVSFLMILPKIPQPYHEL